ncbi:MAG: hypothetical protein AB7U73_20245 [Pirellulales bacterium]
MRRFRFKLSTVLILTAIAAWAMALRPCFLIMCSPMGWEFVNVDDRDAWAMQIIFGRGGPGLNLGFSEYWLEVRVGPSNAIEYPALALAGFLSWKAVWALIERRRRLSAAAE